MIADVLWRIVGTTLCGVMYVVIALVCGPERDKNLEVYVPGQPS